MTENPTKLSDNDAMCIICAHCEQGVKPILLVAFTVDDGLFQFMCGGDHREVDDAHPIHLRHVIEDDASVIPLLNIGQNFIAERFNVKEQWLIKFKNIDKV